jgi:iron complex transport system substrate-binding protein
MKKKLLVLLLIAFGIIPFCGCGSHDSAAGKATTREITDLIGRKVSVPANPSRIAAMTGPSYEMVFMLGGKDRIAMTKSGHTTNYPLALLTNPALANYENVGANPSSSVNIEDYLRRNIDLAIYYDNANELKKFDTVGIPAVVLTLNTGLLNSVDAVKAQTLDDYIDNSTIAVKTLSGIIGGDSVKEAEDWEAYCTKKLTMLYERTNKLSDNQRKTVYWGNTWGENILASYPITNRYYEIWLCGGKLVSPEAGNGNFPEVTQEQLFDWNPDIILVDNHGNYPELVIKSMYNKNSVYASLSAVQNKHLYRIPAGVFFMDKGTTTPLMLVWLATIVQPELFSDIKIIEEVKYYYEEFYECDLTDEQAQKVLDGWYERLGDEPDL